MSKLSLLLPLLFVLSAQAQEHPCAKHKQLSNKIQIEMQAKIAALSPQTSHEIKYDVKFVHLNLEMERNNKFVKGGVTTVATVTAATLDTFQTLLHLNHAIDSVRFNNQLVSVLRQDSLVKIKAPVVLNNGNSFTVTIYYKGTAPSGGGAIGSGYNMGTSGSWGNQATWSLSESFVGYHWWPCKQILTDKIDSSWVFVTTDSTNKVGSNGRLTNVVTVGNKKRYEWKSRTPIDYYLISTATAKYKEYNIYAHPQYLPGDSILIQNYIYDNAINNSNWISQQKTELDKMPQVLEFLSEKYGMYPFYKEKYGHCMAPFGGGMEHQTMTSLGFFEYYINAHELGHQWWGDNVTCKSWGDIWINEGFASYTEHLVAQFLDPSNFNSNLSSVHNNVMSQPGGSVFFTGSDTLNSGRIFSGRLTYDKGGAIIHSLRFLTNNDSLWFQTLRGFQNLHKNSTASAVDFQNYYQAQTGINPAQFFTQWYYGEGYPTFDIKYNFSNGQFFLKTTQSVSMPGVTPLFITPLEYRITRSAMADTFIRVMHSQTIENYTLALNGSVLSVQCDPKNWIINKVSGSVRDMTLGVGSNPAGIEAQQEQGEISIGPNPCNAQLQIISPIYVGGLVQVFDLRGNCILQDHLQAETNLDLSKHTKGIYLVKIYNTENEEIYSQKIIKQ
jgi:aminopeptidase N